MMISNFTLRCAVKKTLLMIARIIDFPRIHPLHLLVLRANERSVAYIENNMPNAIGFDTEKEILAHCLNLADPNGYFLGFGIYKGGTIRYMAKVKPHIQFHGFDSFEGLPEQWSGYSQPKGAFSTGGRMPAVPSNVTLHKGWFADVVPLWLASNSGPVSFAHIDCDIYSSTVEILKNLASRLQPGTVILFDEYLSYPNWEQHEHKAWQEFVVFHRITYDYIAFSHEQVAVRITSMG